MTINYSVMILNEELIPGQLINSLFVRKWLDRINFLGKKIRNSSRKLSTLLSSEGSN